MKMRAAKKAVKTVAAWGGFLLVVLVAGEIGGKLRAQIASGKSSSDLGLSAERLQKKAPWVSEEQAGQLVEELQREVEAHPEKVERLKAYYRERQSKGPDPIRACRLMADLWQGTAEFQVSEYTKTVGVDCEGPVLVYQQEIAVDARPIEKEWRELVENGDGWNMMREKYCTAMTGQIEENISVAWEQTTRDGVRTRILVKPSDCETGRGDRT